MHMDRQLTPGICERKVPGSSHVDARFFFPRVLELITQIHHCNEFTKISLPYSTIFPSPSLLLFLPLSPSLLLSLTERTLEDHEKVLGSLSHWPRGSTNSIVFKNNPEKYYLLKRPQMLMPSSHVYSSVNVTRTAFTEEQKKNIILKVRFN